MNNSLIYRDALQEDLPTIVAIYNSTIASRLVTADTQEVSLASKQAWFDDHNAESRPLWMVYTSAGTLVGWVSFQSFYGRPAYLGTAEISIYLSEQQRGKGYGQQMLSYSMLQAPQLGIDTILGFIFAHNQPSLKLFEKLGFECWAHLKNVALLDGQRRSLCIMGRNLV